MATQPSDLDGVTELCADCDNETLHEVRVELRTESSKDENAEFSREPYRVTTCQECERESIQRMNNA
jgi:formate dehydrogenase assembly factor FdhD